MDIPVIIRFLNSTRELAFSFNHDQAMQVAFSFEHFRDIPKNNGRRLSGSLDGKPINLITTYNQDNIRMIFKFNGEQLDVRFPKSELESVIGRMWDAIYNNPNLNQMYIDSKEFKTMRIIN